MTQIVSIFDGLVDDENSMTQALRNMLVRCPAFSHSLLSILLSSEEHAWRIAKEDIATQKRLYNFGQPDLILKTQEVRVLLEVKLNPKRGLTDHQTITRSPDGELRGYLSYLKKTKEPERWLVFLVPKDWILREEIKISLENLRETNPDIHTNMVFWEDILGMIDRIDSSARDPLIDEFHKLLADRFGPLTFLQEEINMVVSGDFATAYKAVLKLEELVDGICKKTKKHNLAATPAKGFDKDECGIYFKTTNGTDVLWFGYWGSLFEAKGAFLCLAIRDKWKLTAPSLERTFTHCCDGHTNRFENEWDYIAVPRELLESADPLDRIWEFIAPRLEKIIQATNGNPPVTTE